MCIRDRDDDWDERQAVPSGDNGTYEFDSISSMDIELNYDELILRESEDQKITVTVDGDAVNSVRVSTEGSELQIENKDNHRPEERTVTVTYPAGTEFTEVSIDIDAGTAALEEMCIRDRNYAFIGTGFLPTIKVDFAGGTLDLVCVAVAVVVTVGIILSELNTIKTNNKYGFANIVPWQMAVKDIVILLIVWFFFIKLGQYNGIPIQLIVLGLVVAVYHFITSKTVAGRQIYAMGGNAKAARLSGICLLYTSGQNIGVQCAYSQR